MSDKYIYYKDIHESDDVLDLKLTAAYGFYNRIDKSCKELEHKSQQILSASLTTLSIILGFLTLFLKEDIKIEQPILLLTCIFLFLIILLIVLAALNTIRTFKLNTYFLVGRNDIIETNLDYKKSLIAKYVNYAVSNEKTAWQKRDYLKISFRCFNVALILILLYSLFVISFLNQEVFTLINWGLFLNFKKWILPLFLVISILINIFLIKKNRKTKQENNIQNIRKQIQDEAYYNHLKYPGNTDLENWLMAKEKVLISKEWKND